MVPATQRGFAPDACGRIEWGGQPIGYLGQIDPTVAAKISLRHTPVAMEMELAPLLAGHRRLPQLQPLPNFPAVRRDLSLIVADAVRFEKIETLLRGLDLPFLEGIEFVTTYRGKPLEAGSKSVHHHAGLPQSHRHADQRAGRAVRAESRGGRQDATGRDA